MWVGSTLAQLMPSLYFQPNQKAMDNFDTVDLSWLRHTMDQLEVLRHGVSFLEDSSKIDDSNHNVWCNLHITPALEGVMVEVHNLEEVAHWAKRKCLGFVPDPTEPGVVNLIVALGNYPWPWHPWVSQGAGCLGSEIVFSH